MAQLTLTSDVEMEAASDLRRQLREAGADDPPSYSDLVIAAVALALRRHPALNASVVGDTIVRYEQVNIGMAVALDDGLIVPVLRDADRLSLSSLAASTRQLADRARAGTLTVDDVRDATFCVSSLGMLGIDAFTPVINPPNVAILGVGRVRDDVAWIGGAARRARRMVLSLTIDHRAIDGAPGARFLSEVGDLLEYPSQLAEKEA
jgi:pyruvate dehydrogenase E2 component (dihydrolipoamide acetyltransferase)